MSKEQTDWVLVPRDLVQNLEMAISLIQEAKGFEGESGGPITDHLDAAEGWIDRVASAITPLGQAGRELEAFAREWHQQCQSIAAVLDLGEPEIGFPTLVRDKFATAEGRITELEAALSASPSPAGGVQAVGAPSLAFCIEEIIEKSEMMMLGGGPYIQHILKTAKHAKRHLDAALSSQAQTTGGVE